jgi:hypothetical protein
MELKHGPINDWQNKSFMAVKGKAFTDKLKSQKPKVKSAIPGF